MSVLRQATAALAFALAGLVTAQASVSISIVSETGRFRGTFGLAGSATIPTGETHDWTLLLVDAEGRPVDGARIVVGGGMQGHGHGLPTAPHVTATPGNGEYRIGGVKFTMAGEWTLLLRIEHAGAVDAFRVPVQVGTVLDPAKRDEASWSADEIDVLRSLSLHDVTGPPPSPGNRVADDPRAARFGRRLFFDERLSGNGEISCATCHRPEKYFTDGLARSRGTGTTLRNAPTVVGAAHLSWFYWDGRRDSLWSQALIPFEAPDEMGGTRAAVVAVIREDPDYARLYRSIFEEIPGTEGQALDRAFVNVGKALEAYERTLAPPSTRFDRYVSALIHHGEEAAAELLTADERAGLRLFLDDGRTRCLRCHNGPMLTNDSFHNVGTGNFEGERLDFGRVFGLQAVRLDPFNCLGRFSDAEPGECEALRFVNPDAHVPLEGAFKVPTLRGVSATAPYFHDGSRATLEAVIEHYVAPPGSPESHELKPISLTEQERAQLRSFLETLVSRR